MKILSKSNLDKGKHKMKKKRLRKRKTLLTRLRSAQPDWTPFEPATLKDKDLEYYKDTAFPNESLVSVWLNSRYQVLIFSVEAPSVPGGLMEHLSIKRLDQETIHDWREMQRIKNELCGPNRERVEIYPAEQRLVDTSNQYHLWVLPEGVEFPFGFAGRAVSETEYAGNKQRSFEVPPDDLINEEKMQEFMKNKKGDE